MPMQHDMDQFLVELFRDTAPQYFYLWTLANKRSYWFTENSLDDYFAAATTGQIGDRDVYVGVALAAKAGPSTERVTSSSASGLIGLWADIDYLDPLHAKPNLPKDADHALRIMEEFPLQPTLVVQSGHGFHCWWLFQEPWIFQDDEERQAGAMLARRWHHSIRRVLTNHGCAMDSTFDLARVLRVPGTLNCKDPSNPQPVMLRTQRTERFNPSDFDPYLADDIDTTKSEVRLVSDIDPDMEPPPGYQDKFLAVMDNDTNFGDYFFHRKKLAGRANDQSMSSYDLALANIAARVGWSDEEIFILLVKHRKHHGEMFKHKTYYELTIGKARSAQRFEAQAAQVQAVNMAQDAPPALDKDETLRAVSEQFGFPITGLIEYTGYPPRYRLLCGEEEVNLGGSEVWVNQTAFQRKIIEVLGIIPHTLKKNVFQQASNMLFSVREKRSQGEDMTEDGKLRDWLHTFLVSRRPSTTVDGAVTSKASFYHDDAIHIFQQTFKNHLKDYVGERLDSNDIATMFTRIGAETKQIKYTSQTTQKPTTTLARRLPPELFPPANYLDLDEIVSQKRLVMTG